MNYPTVSMLDKRPEQIRSMFAAIAPRYDRANRILSMRVDVLWRNHVARRLLAAPGVVLDLASGTGDLAIALARKRGHRVVAADFTFEMLRNGSVRTSAAGVRQAAADALALPFRGAMFDAVTVAFGVRNFSNPSVALAEIARVLKPGGVAGILEFSTPSRPLNAMYRVYFHKLLPVLGGWITGHRDPYHYLPASVSHFPEGEALLRLLGEAGLTRLSAKRLSGGIATFYRGEKS